MKKWISLLLIAMFMPLPGCWDMREINELGLVMTVGIDKVEGTNDFRVTAQIARPSSQEKGSGVSSEEPVFTASAEGKTIFEAIRNLAKFSSRRIMWAHNNVVIMGESLARDDITPVIDFFTRNQELRMRTWVAVSKGDAREYVSAKTGMETIPGLSISSVFRYSELPAESVKSEMLNLYTDFMSGSVEPLISELVLKERVVPSDSGQEHGGQTQVELSGAAVVKGNKMIGWVTPEEARGLGIVRNEIKSAIVAVKLDGDNNKMFSVEIDNINVKTKVIIKDNMPSITINVKGNGSIAEKDFLSGEMSIDEMKAAIGGLTDKEIEDTINKALYRVQKEYKSDVLGFGRTIHIQHRDAWYGHIKDNWEEIYPEIPVTVTAKIDIHDATLYQKPLNIKTEE